ncbi:addiction module protein [Roseateles toxinivorans]|uniref:Putative addiction module component (TIGR02574 family) n=1 Tax=Roseateles toxinivorans TaxID=270368 RepID=A0A4R6QK92_9BURK|nr:addiction module protein [Roseateles toxinivorans]TDP63333.1 putative addiction module component (TIGR02574 family) [Roseateles toxinivorans]
MGEAEKFRTCRKRDSVVIDPVKCEHGTPKGAHHGVDMPTSVHELEAEVLSLGPADRAHLLERLLESFEPDAKIQDAWLAEALRREAEVSSGNVVLVPADEAIARIRARIA